MDDTENQTADETSETESPDAGGNTTDPTAPRHLADLTATEPQGEPDPQATRDDLASLLQDARINLDSLAEHAVDAARHGLAVAHLDEVRRLVDELLSA